MTCDPHPLTRGVKVGGALAHEPNLGHFNNTTLRNFSILMKNLNISKIVDGGRRGVVCQVEFNPADVTKDRWRHQREKSSTRLIINNQLSVS